MSTPTNTNDPVGEHGGAPIAEGYAAAVAELERILTELERSDVDVDRLATQVQRAQQLITFCRDRIANARVHIEQVVGDLDADSG
jgi:exodeoxyribonuclease VII small subunit